MYTSSTEVDIEAVDPSAVASTSPNDRDWLYLLALTLLLVSLFTMGFITGFAVSMFLLGGLK